MPVPHTKMYCTGYGCRLSVGCDPHLLPENEAHDAGHVERPEPDAEPVGHSRRRLPACRLQCSMQATSAPSSRVIMPHLPHTPVMSEIGGRQHHT